MKNIDELMNALNEASAKGETSITVTTTKLDELIYQLESLLKSTPEV